MAKLPYLSYTKVASGYRVEQLITVELKGHIRSAYICPYFSINGNILTISRGYVWDGASGPVFDTKSIMIASLVHDVCYQLMRLGQLPFSRRKDADREFRYLMHSYANQRIDSRVGRFLVNFRSEYCYFFIRLFGSHFARKSKYDEYKVYTV